MTAGYTGVGALSHSLTFVEQKFHPKFENLSWQKFCQSKNIPVNCFGVNISKYFSLENSWPAPVRSSVSSERWHLLEEWWMTSCESSVLIPKKGHQDHLQHHQGLEGFFPFCKGNSPCRDYSTQLSSLEQAGTILKRKWLQRFQEWKAAGFRTEMHPCFIAIDTISDFYLKIFIKYVQNIPWLISEISGALCRGGLSARTFPAPLL